MAESFFCKSEYVEYLKVKEEFETTKLKCFPAEVASRKRKGVSALNDEGKWMDKGLLIVVPLGFFLFFSSDVIDC